ncbi:hypothetical protein [Pseudotabrizicola sp. L79]|uniref:hypothetical protein n=1 Tax=Pseudotabrizicola sp. L79 TaxID=3118402 RepID=UPI002F95A95F
MYRAAIATLLGVGFLSSSASAFDITGGSVALEYSKFTESPLNDLDKTSLKGSVEIGFSPEFSVQADLGLSVFGFTNADGTNIALHGIYHVNDATSIGAYLGRDELSFGPFKDDVTYLGAEVGHQGNGLSTEVYVGMITNSGINATTLGLGGSYAVTDRIDLGAQFDSLRIDGDDVVRLGLTGDVAATDTISIYGEVGRGWVQSVGSENYLSLGGRYTFGAKGKATFDQRGILTALPGL